MKPESSEDLQFRILALLDGTLDESELARLDAELRASREARELYRKLSLLNIALQEEATGRSGIEQVPVIPIERLLARQRRRVVKASLLAAAAVLLVSALVLWVKMVPRAPAPVADFQVGPDSSFTLSHTGDDAEVKGMVLKVGSQLELNRGTLEASFENGIRCVIEAPAQLEVLAEKHVRLREGSLWSEVPPAGVGFTVQTAQITVVDLGTEFGVVAEVGEGHEVHVTKGSVEMSAGPPGKTARKLILKAGQARRVGAGGEWLKIQPRPGNFTTALPEAVPIANHSFEADKNPSPEGLFADGERADFGGELTGWISQSGHPSFVHVGWRDIEPAQLHPFPPRPDRPAQALSLISGASVLNRISTRWSNLRVGDKLTLTISLGLRAGEPRLAWNERTFFGLTDGSFAPTGIPTPADAVTHSGLIANNPATGDPSGDGTMRDISFDYTVREADLRRPGNIGILLVSGGFHPGTSIHQSFFDNVRLRSSRAFAAPETAE